MFFLIWSWKQQLTTQSHHKVLIFAQKLISDLFPFLDLSVLVFESTYTSETLWSTLENGNSASAISLQLSGKWHICPTDVPFRQKLQSQSPLCWFMSYFCWWICNNLCSCINRINVCCYFCFFYKLWLINHKLWLIQMQCQIYLRWANALRPEIGLAN